MSSDAPASLPSSFSFELLLQPESTTIAHKLNVTQQTIADRIDLPLGSAAEQLTHQDHRPDPEAAFDQLTRQCTLTSRTAHGSPLQLKAATTHRPKCLSVTRIF
jgi:hypothetical protein